MTVSTPAIACTLEGGEFKDRAAWITALNERHLLRMQRADLALELTYDPSSRDQVADLMAREQACCAFLTFALRETDTTVELSIRVPEEAREMTDALLAPFLGGARSNPSPKACGGYASATTNIVPEAAQGPPTEQESSGKKLGATAAAMATVALACGVCCVVPIALPGVALGGFGAVLAWLGGADAAVTTIAAVLVLLGWIWVYRDATRRKARPAAPTLWLMGVASMVLAAAMAWPRLEPAVTTLLGAA